MMKDFFMMKRNKHRKIARRIPPPQTDLRRLFLHRKAVSDELKTQRQFLDNQY